MNMQQLKTMIDDQVSQMNLQGVLDDAAIEQIKLKVMSAYNHEKAINEIPEIIPEAVVSNVAEDPMEEPQISDEEINGSIESVGFGSDGTQTSGQNIDQGTSGNIPAHTPELPYFLDKIEPGKVIIFSQNELSESGENLSLKPIRTFADPDQKKSMRELWLEQGQKKADVYLAKLEKIGEMNYDVANGTTVFTEKRFDPDFEAQAKYKENPYMGNNIVDDSQIVRQIASSVDLQKTVEDMVIKMIQKQAMQNTAMPVPGKSIDNIPLRSDDPYVSNRPTVMNSISESFDLKIRTIADTYQKIDTPKALKEAIEKGDKTFLSKENDEVQEWAFEDKKYYTPVNKISTRKCYIK